MDHDPTRKQDETTPARAEGPRPATPPPAGPVSGGPAVAAPAPASPAAPTIGRPAAAASSSPSTGPVAGGNAPAGGPAAPTPASPAASKPAAPAPEAAQPTPKAAPAYGMAPQYGAPAYGQPSYNTGYNAAAGGPTYSPPPTPPVPPAPPAGGGKPPRKRRRRRTGRTVLTMAAVIAMVGVFLASLSLFTVTTTFSSLLQPAAYRSNPPANSFSVVQVVGNIQNLGNDPYSTYAPSYCHYDTVDHIKRLAGSANNTGILLYMNTPGGGVYESDEVYLALEDYKEKTGRPVWAYMADMCASGGYYIAAAADRIVANRNTTTGSIGVYIALTDTSGLYDKLGIETVLVRSGENKGAGMSGVPVTEGQRQVYQSVVDESYQQFVDLVANGRGMSEDEVRQLADGRIYTGAQALELKLVDELGNWDDTLAAFEEETGAEAFWPSFNQQVGLARLIGSLSASLPAGDAEAAIKEAERYPVGVPMALYNP